MIIIITIINVVVSVIVVLEGIARDILYQVKLEYLKTARVQRYLVVNIVS